MYLGGQRDTGTRTGTGNRTHRNGWASNGLVGTEADSSKGGAWTEFFIIIFIDLYLDGILGVVYWGMYMIDGGYNAYIPRYSRTKT